MTQLPFFQVDAFAEAPLTGNPAAVMPGLRVTRIKHYRDVYERQQRY